MSAFTLVRKIARKDQPDICIPASLLQLAKTDPAVQGYLTALALWCKDASESNPRKHEVQIDKFLPN